MELSDEELDKKFEMMSRECANSMNGTHPPKKIVYSEPVDYFSKEIRGKVFKKEEIKDEIIVMDDNDLMFGYKMVDGKPVKKSKKKTSIK